MIPINLKVKNFFSHRNTEVDFTKFDAALLIGNVEGDYNISNGSGKSAVFEAILWCLFNKARTATIDDIIMWNESNCSVSFEFIHHGEKYRVIRTRSRTTGTSTVEFYIDDGGTWRDQSGSTARLTNAEIIKIIRVDYKTFINSAYFRQNDISEFAESDAGRKKEILKSIIDISKWDEYEKTVKAELKIYKRDCTILSAEVHSLEEAKTDLAESEIKLDELTRQLKLKSEERIDTDRQVEVLSDKYSSLKQSLDTDQWDKIVEENLRLANQKKTLSSKGRSLVSEIKSYTSKISSLQKQIADSTASIESLTVDLEAPAKLSEKTSEKHKYQAEIISSEERLNEFEQLEITDGSCYICGQDVSDELSQRLHKEHDDKVSTFKKRVVFGKNRVNQLKDEVRTLDKAVRDNKRHASLEASISSATEKKSMLENHLGRLSSESENITREIKDITTKLDGNEQVLESLKSDDFNNLRVEIKRLKGKRITLQKSLESINRDLGVYSQKVINLKEKIGKMIKSQEKLTEKKKKLLVFERFAKLLGKNGIQTILLNAVIEDLEATSNEILTSICNEPFQIILETQRVGSDGISIVDTLDLKVKKDGITQNFKSLSGGEQFRISLALRIALSEISSKHGGSSLDFLLLDEINSPLDRHGTENLFVNVIRSLETKYKILVITHDDLLKERFDNVLDVTKVNGESSVKFIAK